MEQDENTMPELPEQNESPTEPEKNSIGSEIWSWVKTILLALLLAIFINTCVIVNATVPTGSMENTIMPKDRILAFRLSYVLSEPERGDVVVFRYPDDPTGDTLYVKRVIGLPGETIEVKDGVVFVDNVGLEETYLKEETYGDFGPYEVPEDSYFMMGDNRNNSLDSRYWSNKFVEEDEILGKVFIRYFPSPKVISSRG